MKFKNRAANIAWTALLCWSGTIHALSNTNNGAKTTVYPSVLYPGKVWTVSPPAENISQHSNVWQNNDVNTTHYRPLDDETPHRSEKGDYCVPNSPAPRQYFENDSPDAPRYRSELYEDTPDMPRYRNEMKNNSNQYDNRYPQRERVVPRRERDQEPPPQFSPSHWQSQSERFYDYNFPATPYIQPTRDLMDDPLFSGEFSTYPPLSPEAWNPYIRNNFSSKNTPLAPPTQHAQQQVPLKNDRLPPSTELSISADWIPAPNSALVDSEEFTPSYAETPVPLRPNDDNVAIGEAIRP